MALPDDLLEAIDEGVSEVGKSAVIRRITYGDDWIDENIPSKGKKTTEKDYTAIVAVVGYESSLVDGTIIQAGDRMVVVSLGSVVDDEDEPVVGFIPTVDDFFVENAAEDEEDEDEEEIWKIINVETQEVLGTVVSAILQVRK